MLSSAIIRFVVDDPAMQEREFEQMRVLVSKCPIFELRRPAYFSELGPTLDVISWPWHATPARWR